MTLHLKSRGYPFCPRLLFSSFIVVGVGFPNCVLFQERTLLALVASPEPSQIGTSHKSKENITFAIPYEAVTVNSLTRLQAKPACR